MVVVSQNLQSHFVIGGCQQNLTSTAIGINVGEILNMGIFPYDKLPRLAGVKADEVTTYINVGEILNIGIFPYHILPRLAGVKADEVTTYKLCKKRQHVFNQVMRPIYMTVKLKPQMNVHTAHIHVVLCA